MGGIFRSRAHADARPRDPGWPDRSSQEPENPLLSNAGHAGMEDTCPICKRRLEAHDDGQMVKKDSCW